MFPSSRLVISRHKVWNISNLSEKGLFGTKACFRNNSNTCRVFPDAATDLKAASKHLRCRRLSSDASEILGPASSVTLYDGAVGSELERRLKASGTEIVFDGSWSAGMMAHSPKGYELLKQVHADYLRAGARVVTTNTYSVTPSTAEATEIPLENLVGLAVTAAVEARQVFLEEYKIENVDAVEPEVLVCGSVPPLRSSFQPEALPDDETLKKEYSQLCSLLVPKVDAIFIETLSCIREVLVCLDVCKNYQKPSQKLFLGVGVYENATLPSGEGVGDMLDAIFKKYNSCLPFDVLNFNCSTMDNIEGALEKVREWEGLNGKTITLGAYPNRMDHTVGSLKQKYARDNQNGDPEFWNRITLWKGEERAFAQRLMSWHVHYNVQYLGGCCLFGPEYIQALNVAKSCHVRHVNLQEVEIAASEKQQHFCL